MIVGSFPYFFEVQPVFGALAAETVGDLAILGDDGPASSSGQPPCGPCCAGWCKWRTCQEVYIVATAWCSRVFKS